MGTRAKLLTATVALGLVSLYVSHLKRRFRRGACAAVRVFLNEVQKVRQETLTVTWFSRRPMADVGQFAALLDPKVELLVVGSGRLGDVDARTQVLISSDPQPYEADSGGQFERLARLEAFLQPYAGVAPAVSRALRRERRRRNARDLAPLLCCNSHHNAPMTSELAVGLVLAAAKRLCVADAQLRVGDGRRGWLARGCGGGGTPGTQLSPTA